MISSIKNIEKIKKSVYVRTLLGLVIIGLLLITAILLPLTGDLKAKNQQEIHFIVDARAAAVNQYISKITNIAEQFTSRTQIRRKLMAYNEGNVSLEALVQFSSNKLLDAMKKSEDAIGITRLDITGTPVVIIGEALPKDFIEEFDRNLNKTTVFDPIRVAGTPYIIVATPIVDRNKTKVGIDLVLYHTDNLKKIIQDYSGLGDSGETLLTYGPMDQFHSLFPTRNPVKSKILTQVRRDFIQQRFTKSMSIHPMCDECVTVIRNIEQTSWQLFFKMKKSELNQIIDTTNLRLILVSLFIILIGMLGIYLLTNPLLRSLEEDLKERIHAEKAIRDLNESLEKRVEQRTHDLEKAKNQAEIANRAKSTFLANMSHELRTPLNAILGFSKIMESDKKLDKENKNFLAIINRSGQHLLDLINDILDMSKIEAGRIKLVQEVINLEVLVRDIITLLRVKAEEKGIAIQVQKAADFPLFVAGDTGKIRQILINLLSNAIKFTPEGYVELRLSVLSRSTNQLKLHIAVIDTGIGIPSTELETIFKPFEQLTESQEQKGTGLGLAITKEFINLMGGQITVQSELNKGTQFEFDLLLSKAEVAHPEVFEPKIKEILGLANDSLNPKILIAEDQVDSALLLKHILEKVKGFDVRIAKDGLEAIEIYTAWQPHLIWMDRRMPRMDGLEASKKIRNLPNGKEVTIIALTASTFKEEKDEMLQAGLDDFVSKPYAPETIFKLIQRHLNVKFIYEETVPANHIEPESATTDLSELKRLPPALQKEIVDACLDLSFADLQKATTQVAEHNPKLAQLLTELTDRFEFTEIIEAINH